MLLFYNDGNRWELDISVPDIICPMDKHKFIALAGSQSELARILGIKQPSVAQWKTVPQARIWQLKLLRPEWFMD
jgi:hypothetical protein